VALTSILFYLHYTSILVLAGEAVYYVALHARRAGRPGYHWRHFLLDLALVMLCLTPALPHLMEIASRRDNWAMFIRRGPLQDIWYLFPLYLYLQVPAQIVGVAYLVHWTANWLKRRVAQETASQRGEAGTSTDPGRADAAGERRASVAASSLLCVCWLFVPLLLAWTSTHYEFARLFFPRYLIVCALAPILLCGTALAVCPSRLFRLVLVAAVVWLSIGHSGILEQYRRDGRVIGDRNQDWRAAVTMVNEASQGRCLPVFVRSGLIEAAELRSSDAPQLSGYCLLPVRGIYRLQRADDLLSPLSIYHSGRLTIEQREQIEKSGGGWFILAGLPSTITNVQTELLANWAESPHQPTVVEREAYGNVTVLRMTVNSIRPTPESS
jgi:hypothetical protein